MVDNQSSVSLRRNPASNYFRLLGLSPNGFPHVQGSGYDGETTWESLYTSDQTQIDDFVIYFYVGRDFEFIQARKVLVCTITCNPMNDLFRGENDYSSRVPFRQTKFPQHADFADCFVSNMYFCTKESALMLGHFECLLRTNKNDFLYEKLLPSKPNLPFRNHYKALFDYLLGSKKEEKELRIKLISSYVSYNLDDPSSVQKLADNYSVGICMINMKNQFEYTKYMILPGLPEIAPIPIVKLISYGNYTCVFYSSTQNEFDGFDKTGKISKSYENETIIDSFYIIEDAFATKNCEFIDIIEKLSTCFFNENDKRNTEKLNEVVKKIESNDGMKASLNTSVVNFKNIINKIKQNSSSSQPVKQVTEESKTSMFIDKKAEIPYQVPTPVIPKNTIYSNNMPNNSATSYISNAQNTNNSLYPQKNAENTTPYNPVNPSIVLPSSKTVFNPAGMNNPASVYPKNTYLPTNTYQVPDPNKKNAYGSNTQVKFDSSKTYVAPRPSTGKALCSSCRKSKKCEILHESCNMCQGCIVESINSKDSKCYVCRKAVSTTAKSKFINKKEWVCDSCGKTGKARKSDCGCFLCEDSCARRSHNCT